MEKNKYGAIVDRELEYETLLRIFEKIEECLRQAYYSTPDHISSKTLIYRALLLARNGVNYVYKLSKKNKGRT